MKTFVLIVLSVLAVAISQLVGKHRLFRSAEASPPSIPSSKSDDDLVHVFSSKESDVLHDLCILEKRDFIQSFEGSTDKLIDCAHALALEHEGAFKSDADGRTSNGNRNKGGNDSDIHNLTQAILRMIVKEFQEHLDQKTESMTSSQCHSECKYFWCKPPPTFLLSTWWKWFSRLCFLKNLWSLWCYMMPNVEETPKKIRGWSHAIDGELEIVFPHAGDDACDATIVVYATEN